MDKLLDCPFCGGRSQEVVSNDVAVVCCMSCFATASPEQWNTRHTPEGWQLVPVEADDSMRQAFNGQHDLPYNPASEREYRPIHTWKRMLAAAPKWGGE